MREETTRVREHVTGIAKEGRSDRTGKIQYDGTYLLRHIIAIGKYQVPLQAHRPQKAIMKCYSE